MIYICTVHYKTDKWIKPQLVFLEKYLQTEFKVLACLSTPAPQKQFHFEISYEPDSPENQNHAGKLNYLARVAALEAKPDDILLFLDGDAFPIQPISAFLKEKLAMYDLVAVQRRENNGDIQPHPCFCATTFATWEQIQGDWSPGPAWNNKFGFAVTDVGGTLLANIEKAGGRWYPMLRTNRNNLHPLWFGIYEDRIYHHGAGYREPISRVDLNMMVPTEFTRTADYMFNQNLQKRVFRRIKSDPNFYRRFLSEPTWWDKVKQAVFWKSIRIFHQIKMLLIPDGTSGKNAAGD
jgi:hypothetical protein